MSLPESAKFLLDPDAGIFAVRSDPKIDTRGALMELVRNDWLPNADPPQQVFAVVINPLQTRGGHYHKRKSEWFSVVTGVCRLELYDRKRDELLKISVGPYEEFQTVRVPPGISHRFTALGLQASVVVACPDECHNPQDEDTYPEEAWQE